jgi:hypothetical protein
MYKIKPIFFIIFLFSYPQIFLLYLMLWLLICKKIDFLDY